MDEGIVGGACEDVGEGGESSGKESGGAVGDKKYLGLSRLRRG